MADVVFILVMLGLFGAAVLLVRFCERVVGPEELVERQETEVVEEVAA